MNRTVPPGQNRPTRISKISRQSTQRVRDVSVEEMQRIDALTIETLGVPRLLLMEHAGFAIAHAVRTLSSSPTRPIVVCCGSGFNGGDGLAAARLLHCWGYSPRIALLAPLASLREEPAIYANMLRRLNQPFVECASVDSLSRIEAWWNNAAVIIDALLGIGVRGDVREPIATCIGRMNRSGRPIVAADIPSGLNGDSGTVQGIAVRATLTVAFGLPKQGCFRAQGPAHTGSLITDSITIPPTLLEPSTS